MNKSGFTLIELIAVILVMTLIMTFAFPSFQRLIDQNKRKKYESFEKTISEYAKVYCEDCTNTVNIESIKNKLESNFLNIDSDCVGYVDFNDDYKAYIRCGDKYETNDFNEDFIY